MPMKRELYPANWDEIADQVKEAAGWVCQKCGKPCRRPGESTYDLALRLPPFWTAHLFGLTLDASEEDFYDSQPMFGRFTLTVAHLNHLPGDCRFENLKALCSVCHLRYDNRARAEKRRMVSGGGNGT